MPNSAASSGQPCRLAPVQAVAAHDDVAGALRQCLYDPPYPVQPHPPHHRVRYLGCALVRHELGQGGSVFRGAVRLIQAPAAAPIVAAPIVARTSATV